MSGFARHVGRWGGAAIILLFVAASAVVFYSTPSIAHAQCASDCNCSSGQTCDLLSGACVPGTNTCVPPSPGGGGGGSSPQPDGSGCSTDSQCSSGYCDPTSQSCQTIGGLPGGSGSSGSGGGNYCDINLPCYPPQTCDYSTNQCVSGSGTGGGTGGNYCDINLPCYPPQTCDYSTNQCVSGSGGGGAGGGGGTPVGGSTPGGSASVTLTNPLGSCNDLTCALTNVINFIFTLSIPIFGIMIIVGGFQMLTAGGNPEKFSRGRKTLLYSVIGFVVILLAGSIANLIKSIFGG